MNFSLSDILHTVGQALAVPCNIVLILLMIITLVQVGHVAVESFYERKHFKTNFVRLAKQLQNAGTEEKRMLINNSSLYRGEKAIIMEIIDSENMTEDMRRAIASRLLAEQEEHYGKILGITEMAAKLGPMFGLLGTLIPLGPGIVALGRGDTQTLSNSMEMAFDTTIAGVISAAVCSVLSAIRKRWYTRAIGNIELVMEALV